MRSAEAFPALIVTFPTANDVIKGGSSLDRLTTLGSLDVHVRPETTSPFESRACRDRESPTTMLITFGTRVTAVSPLRLGGTAKASALLQIPFCWTFTIPVTALAATEASI